MSYSTLLSIKEKDFSDKSVLIIGAGWMADQFALALKAFKINNVSVISRTESSATKLAQGYGFLPFWGGYAKCLPEMKPFDLVIVATSVHEIVPAAEMAIKYGNKNVLIEKPGSLYATDLQELQMVAKKYDARVRVAYNRLTYPNYWKLCESVERDGGILSCRYTFTELIRSINFEKDIKEAYTRWGISNSLHVIGTAHSLIGMPKEWKAFQHGSLEWHPSGAQFVGAGITEKAIPFSYHADWASAGRWGIEIMSPEYAYRLVPMEKLFRCKRGTFQWEEVEFEVAFPDVKQGVAEEIAVMFDEKIEREVPLAKLSEAGKIISVAEEIMGYADAKA